MLSNEENTLVVAGNLGRGKVVVFGTRVSGIADSLNSCRQSGYRTAAAKCCYLVRRLEQAKALVANERVAAALNDGSNIETTVVDFDLKRLFVARLELVRSINMMF